MDKGDIMALDISFEYIATIDDLGELNDISKIIQFEQGQLNRYDSQVRRTRYRIKQREKLKLEEK